MIRETATNLLQALLGLLRSRAVLLAENALLRQQLIVLRRSTTIRISGVLGISRRPVVASLPSEGPLPRRETTASAVCSAMNYGTTCPGSPAAGGSQPTPANQHRLSINRGGRVNTNVSWNPRKPVQFVFVFPSSTHAHFVRHPAFGHATSRQLFLDDAPCHRIAGDGRGFLPSDGNWGITSGEARTEVRRRACLVVSEECQRPSRRAQA
jgi:hypothetical protein